MTTEWQQETHICKSCGNEFIGLYCNLCGEKVILAKDRKFKTFLGSVLIATTIVDNKFIKSLWLIIKNPGFLSKEYVEGKRVRYMRPLQIFFILNLIYFLFPVLQMFNSSLFTQRYILPHGRLAQEIVQRKITSEKIDIVAFEIMYNTKTTSLAKLLIVVFVLLASLPLSLIFLKKNRYFTDHVALSVELTCFNLAVNAVGLSIVFWLANKVLHWNAGGYDRYLNDLTLTIIFVSTNLYFLFRAAQTFYNQKGKRLVIKAIGGILGLFFALEIYRFILFFLTIWSL
ncbi:MAG: DUF3667 domain-containing protein [Cyclobacteriaceae bacterium]|nr:DUF3667 domain-containing protein [Cyclobacteriaceae bacterium]